MKRVKLTTWDRLNLLNCLPQRTTLNDISRLLKLQDKLELSESEGKRVNLHVDTLGNASWDNAEHAFVLNFEDNEYSALASYAEAYPNWPATKATALFKKHFFDEVEEYEVK